MKQTLSFSKIRFTHNFKVLSRLLTLIISKRFTCVSLLGGTPEKRLMGEIYESTNTFNHPVLTAKIRAVLIMLMIRKKTLRGLTRDTLNRKMLILIWFWFGLWAYFGLSRLIMEELSWVCLFFVCLFFIQVVITLIRSRSSARNARDAQMELSSTKTKHQEQKRQIVKFAHQVSLCWTHEPSRSVRWKRTLHKYLFLCKLKG